MVIIIATISTIIISVVISTIRIIFNLLLLKAGIPLWEVEVAVTSLCIALQVGRGCDDDDDDDNDVDDGVDNNNNDDDDFSDRGR